MIKKEIICSRKIKKKLMILLRIYIFLKNKFIYTGLISCLEKIDLIDLLKAVQWQNERVSLNKNSINIITVHKDNLFGNKQQKFFKFKTLDKKSVLYKEAKKVMNLNSRFNAYYKVIK